jgi:tetratricopeptide (TPR) repeat protein
MPLAIELAAARTRAMTPHQIAARLDDRFRLLTGGARTALPRHQTLRAVVAWSWDLLDERERAVARRLSVFAGGATLEDAEAVVADGDLVAPEDVLDVLAGLVDRSLVDATGTTTTRYRMLETIQAYAAERLAESGERDRVRAAHVARFVDLAETAEPHLRTAGQLPWLARLAAEHDNFAEALHTAAAAGDADAAVRLTAALVTYWIIHGAAAEAQAWLEETLAVPGPAPAEPLALVRLVHGASEMAEGRHIAGLRSVAHARRVVRRLGHRPRHPMLRYLDALPGLGREDLAAVTEALDRARNDDPWTRAAADLVQGHMAINLGDITMGFERIRAAHEAFTGIGDRWGAGTAATGLGELRMFAGEHDAAIAAFDEAVALFGEIGVVDDLPFVLVRRGTLWLRAGHPDRARADMAEALRASETHDGLASGQMPARAGLAEIALRLGDLDEAERQLALCRAVLDRSRRVPLQSVAVYHQITALTALARGDLARARAERDLALRAALTARDMPVLAVGAECAAAVAVAEGDPARCAELLGWAEALRGGADEGSLYVPPLVRAGEQALGAEEFARARARAANRPRPEILELLGDGDPPGFQALRR